MASLKTLSNHISSSNTANNILKLGVLDWGLGGFSFVQHLQKHCISIPMLYFSDSGFPPYGTCRPQDLKARLKSIFIWCFERGCSHIVVACNAASSVLSPEDEFFLDKDKDGAGGAHHQRIIAIIRPTISCLNSHLQSGCSLHVIGGKRTIESQVYQKEGLIKHTAQVAQPLSACIERGVTVGEEIDEILCGVLQPKARHLLLACTHYEVLLPTQLRVHMPLLETVWYPSQCVYHYMTQHFAFMETQRTLECYTTGDPTDMHIRAMGVFGVVGIPAFEKVGLSC